MTIISMFQLIRRICLGNRVFIYVELDNCNDDFIIALQMSGEKWLRLAMSWRLQIYLLLS